jgi:HD-like signal output (HDOD) protein/CheY-like chemotaxis protein
VKKRVLFVDDDVLVLKGLQRMLRSLQNQWHMEFVDSGTLALARMAETQFDVLVTDMRMPGMNGSELLEEVVQRHPQTVRIILSGHADKDLILKCVGSTHQFLSKPCDSESLKSTIQRACNSEDSMQNTKLKQLVTGMNRLPSLPSLYVEIVEKLNDAETTIEDIGAIIIKDLGMTAQILKLVNSAFFGHSQPVSSPSEAAMYLGIDTIKSLVLSIHAFSQFKDLKDRGFNLDALVRHSLNTGARAKQIAASQDANKKLCDDCFVAGMLHDTGKLVLAANYPEDYERVKQLTRAGSLSGCEAEKEIFGVNHATVGGYLLGLWGLPVPVVEAIALHHSPQLNTSPEFSALTAVHVANVLEHERTEPLDPAEDEELHNEYLTGLGLTKRVAVWRASSEHPTIQTANS